MYIVKQNKREQYRDEGEEAGGEIGSSEIYWL